jgi:RNAse (barnase) inhibitor barstar
METKKTKTKITAAELMERLQKDKEYTGIMKEKEEKLKDFQELLNNDEQPIIKDIEKVGIKINSVWDLVNTSKPYPVAIPFLIKHLKKNYHQRTKAGIARALAVPEARESAWEVLLDEYDKAISDEEIEDPKKRGYKDGLAAAISFLADKNRIDIIFELVRDKRHGKSRVFFVEKLFKLRGEYEVMQIVLKIKDDKDLSTAIKEKFKI